MTSMANAAPHKHTPRPHARIASRRRSAARTVAAAAPPAPSSNKPSSSSTASFAAASNRVAPSTKAAKSVGDIRKLKLITAVKTPYLEDGRFDFEAYDRIVDDQIAHGVEGLIVGGTTGEGHLMSWDEHIMLIAHTVNQFGDRLTVIGNTGSNSTREALHATEQGFNVGMHASLQINPYYGKTSNKGMAAHLKAGLAEGPGIVYNVPARTSQDIPDEVIEELSQHENFLGVKECTGNDRIANYTKKGIVCWSGNDDEAHDARHIAGAAGVISVTSNVIPGLFSSLMDARDDELNEAVQPLVSWMFREPNPTGLNTMLSMMGACKPVFRMPYMAYEKEWREEGVQLLEALGGSEVAPSVRSLSSLDDDDFTYVYSSR